MLFSLSFRILHIMSTSYPLATLSIIPLCMPHSNRTPSLNIYAFWAQSWLTVSSWPGLSLSLSSFYKNSTTLSRHFQNTLLPWKFCCIPYNGWPILPLCMESSSVTIFKSSYLCTCVLLVSCQCPRLFCLSQSPRAPPSADQCTKHLLGMESERILIYLQ